jgi:peptidoglycan/xylan/chitin deacetylase (PgdA/CDA1 family)
MLRPFLRKVATSLPFSVYRLFVRRNVLGFYYHVVSDEPLPHVRHLYSYKSLRMFEDDLAYLTKHYQLITYEQLAAHCADGQRLKSRSVLLTFDDGLSECYFVVRPVLLKLGVPCTFFVPTDCIDNRSMCPDHKASLCIDRVASLKPAVLRDAVRSAGADPGKDLTTVAEFAKWALSVGVRESSTIDRLCLLLAVDVDDYLRTKRPYLSADEIRDMTKEGFTIGAHSVRHQELGRLAESEAVEDIVTSCRVIASLSGKPQVPFAFPFTADGISDAALHEVRRRYNHVGLFFGTGGVSQDRSLVINRMCGDRPAPAGLESSNLPQALAQAYSEEIGRRARRSVRENRS